MIRLSNKKVERKSNLESALIIIAFIAIVLIPVIIWGNIK